MSIPYGLAVALKILGGLLIFFALVDVVLANFMNIDITGVSWSPIAAGVTGSALLRFFGSAGE